MTQSVLDDRKTTKVLSILEGHDLIHHIWVILKTYVSLALHSKRYETRLKQTAEVCIILLMSDVHCFEKHPSAGVTTSSRYCKELGDNVVGVTSFSALDVVEIQFVTQFVDKCKSHSRSLQFVELLLRDEIV